MHLSCFFLIPLLVIAWICVLVIIRNSFVPTSIELNISDSKNIISTNYLKKKNVQRVRPKYHVPRFMLELYEKNKEIRENCSQPDIVRSLIPKHATPIENEVIEANNHLLIFDLPTSSDEEQFVSAELKILTLVETNSKISGVERQLKISVYDDSTKTFYNLQKLHIFHSNNTWLSFNLTKPVVKILQRNGKYLKIIISLSAFLPYFPENSLKLSLMPVQENFEHDYPVLLLSYISNVSRSIKRKKRSLEEDYEEETNNIWDDDNARKIQMKKIKRIRNSCRRKPLYINFSEIEYDLWIVQPPGYDAYQCQGKCFYPVADHLNPTKHAIVQALLHSVAPSKASRSCCVPTLLDSISILYIDEKGVLTYRYGYKDMVVLECGCR